MTTELKPPSQLTTSAATLADLYTVPSGRTAVCSSLVIANRNSSDTVFRVSVAIGGVTDAPEQYLYYDCPIAANSTIIATLGITLGQNDVVRVYSLIADVSFNLFKQERY